MAETDSKSPSVGFTMMAAISAVILLGLAFGASLWVLAGIVAVGVIAINRFLALTWATCTVAVRSGGDEELKVGQSLRIRITVTNTSRVPVFWVLAEDLVPKWTLLHSPPTLAIEGGRLRVLLLWAGESDSFEYTIRCNRRGYFQIGPTVLETGDFMGLYRRYRVGTDPQYLTVLPRTIELSDYEIASRRPMGEIRMRDNIMEDPTRLRGIRRWQPGDPMRRIHWSATARTGVLHSKVYEPTSIAGATLVLDLHTETNPARHEPVRTDLAITTAASIANSLHDDSQPFALVTNGRDAADRIRTDGWVGDHRVRGEAQRSVAMNEENERLRPIVMDAGRGTLHLQEMKRQLARLERTDGMTFAKLLTETESNISSETTLVAILQKATPETMSTLIGLARRGKAVAVIVNVFEINDYSAIAGPLIAANIQTFQLADEDSIRDICRNVDVRTV